MKMSGRTRHEFFFFFFFGSTGLTERLTVPQPFAQLQIPLLVLPEVDVDLLGIRQAVDDERPRGRRDVPLLARDQLRDALDDWQLGGGREQLEDTSRLTVSVTLDGAA